MKAPGLKVEQRGSTRWIFFDRPARMNAVRIEELNACADEVRAASVDSQVRVIVLAGSGQDFCSGADLGGDSNLTPESCDAVVAAANELVTAVAESPRPVVVRARGACVGVGASLALVADLAFADEDSYLLLSFSRIGLMPDGGATALVAAAAGRARAMRLALLAQRVPGQAAADLGLLAATWRRDEYEARLDDVIAVLSSGPTGAYAATKSAINLAAWGDLSEVLERESAGQNRLVRQQDFAEGVLAFQEHRRPLFTGR